LVGLVANAPIKNTWGLVQMDGTAKLQWNLKLNERRKNKVAEDNTNTNPSHYKQGDIEVIDFILDQKMDYLTANVQKYIARWRFKDGICDLRKARWFLDKLIEQQLENSDVDNKLFKETK
jgi:hypothetical protein